MNEYYFIINCLIILAIFFTFVFLYTIIKIFLYFLSKDKKEITQKTTLQKTDINLLNAEVRKSRDKNFAECSIYEKPKEITQLIKSPQKTKTNIKWN